MNVDKYVIGLDFGTDSVRALLVNAANGKEVATSVVHYKRWSQGKYQDPSVNMFRHHPLDYLEALEEVIKKCLNKIPEQFLNHIIAIGVDTTGSTPAPVNRDGTVLALEKEFTDNPNAMFVLWKDHTSTKEAAIINKAAKTWGGTDFTKYSGGVYSSEWFFSKILHILKIDDDVRDAAYSWVELADWIPAVLTAKTAPRDIKRSRCAAGHKAMWHEDWNGLPPEEFLVKVDPLLRGLRDRLYTETFTSEAPAGHLSENWAQRLGLNTDVAVTIGAFDPHMGAVGARIKEGVFVKVIGTSCCDMAVGKKEKDQKLISGICGQVDGSILPDMLGYEAGQSSFGDVYAWFKEVLLWPLKSLLKGNEFPDQKMLEKIYNEVESNLIKNIEKEAEKINPEETSLICLDWLNGRRTPYADQNLKGVIAGLTLGSDAIKIYRSLAEATAFGSRAIIERFRKDGLEINEVSAIGGIPKKSSLVMQILADVLNMPVKVAKSAQSVALGAAIFGAVAAGYYDNIYLAQEKMGSSFVKTYRPIKENVKTYERLYGLYTELSLKLEDFLRKL
jgi:L-ribulokinase